MTKTIVQAIAVAQTLPLRAAHHLHCMESGSIIKDASCMLQIYSVLQAVHDARKTVEEITVPPSAGRSEPATKTVVQAIAVAQALRSRVAHRLHYIASQTGIIDTDADSVSIAR